jgi:hypothetical protein
VGVQAASSLMCVVEEHDRLLSMVSGVECERGRGLLLDDGGYALY